MTDSTVPTDTESVGRNGKPRLRGWKLFLRDVVVIFVIALVVSVLIKTFLVRSFYIPSESMSDTLVQNDRIIVNQLAPDLMHLQHGDVVVFKDPGNWLTPTPPAEQNAFAAAVDWTLALVGLAAPDSNDHLIKRVIGLPGDHVVCCNELGQLSVNDVPLDEPYVSLPDGSTDVSKDDFDVTVPANSLWVMGDNRYNSKDSRYQQDTPSHGFVPLDDVVGRALLISWPISRWTWLDNAPDTFRGVEQGTASE